MNKVLLTLAVVILGILIYPMIPQYKFNPGTCINALEDAEVDLYGKIDEASNEEYIITFAMLSLPVEVTYTDSFPRKEIDSIAKEIPCPR